MNDTPRYAPVPRASEILGIGRTKIYDFAGRGLIRIVKVGHRSLVDIEQALGWMATLPEAHIAPQIRKSGGTGVKRPECGLPAELGGNEVDPAAAGDSGQWALGHHREHSAPLGPGAGHPPPAQGFLGPTNIRPSAARPRPPSCPPQIGAPPPLGINQKEEP